MNWEFQSDRPIYAQLIEQITTAIVSGEFPPGERLPSVRDLAQEASVNPNTMQKALTELEREGLVCTQRTAGRTITQDAERIEQLRIRLALRMAQEFLSRMDALRIPRSRIPALLQQTQEEEQPHV